jgi:hypothetical protein
VSSDTSGTDEQFEAPGPPDSINVAVLDRPNDPNQAEYQGSGKQPMSDAAKQRIEERREATSPRRQARERARAIADELTEGGKTKLGQRLRQALGTTDANVETEVIGMPSFVLAEEDQLWLHIEVLKGTLEVWVNERELGSFTPTDSQSSSKGWQIVGAPEVEPGENTLMVVVTADAQSNAFEARVLPRLASTGEDLHPQTVHVSGTAAPGAPPLVYLCRFYAG